MKIISCLIFLLLVANYSFSTTAYVKPTYPKYAIENCIEGYVLVSFLIVEGKLDPNIKILESNPEGVFEESAIINLKRDHNSFLNIAKENGKHEFIQKFTFEFAEPCEQENS